MLSRGREESDLDRQSTFEAAYERVCFERFPQEASRATGKRPFFQTRIITRGDHDHWRQQLLFREVLLEFGATHARHLDVRDDAGKALDNSASKERLSGRKTVHLITSRADQSNDGSEQGFVIVDNRNQILCWHARLFP